jgi:uncharacterized delta-60 repeat protein
MKKYLVYLILSYSLFGYSQAGSFDITFDGDGKNVTCPVGNFYNRSSKFQSTGKIVLYGGNYLSCDHVLLRYNTNGSLDTTFGTNGVVENTYCNLFTGGSYSCYDMVVQNDDKIVMMGLRQTNDGNNYWIARLLPNGGIDSSFNTTGLLHLSFGTPQDRGTCVTVQPDGKILVGGTSGTTAQFFTVARLLSNGTLDTTFGVNGVAQYTFSGLECFVNSIALQPNGKMVLGGYTVTATHAKDFGLMRLNANGLLDTTFGTNGKVITTLSDTRSDIIDKVLIMPNGKIVVGGYTSFESDPKLAAARYLPNGVLDTSFGINGIIINEYTSTNCDIALQADNKLIMVGGFDSFYFRVLRYTENGILDTGFGTNGLVTVFDPAQSYAARVLIQLDNNIVVTGTVAVNTSGCAAIIRLNPGTLSNEEFSNTAVSLYPNPTSGLVFFENSETRFANVRVYNYLGQEVMPSHGITGDNNSSIDISSLSKGVYLFKFEGGQQSGWARVMKE